MIRIGFERMYVNTLSQVIAKHYMYVHVCTMKA